MYKIIHKTSIYSCKIIAIRLGSLYYLRKKYINLLLNGYIRLVMEQKYKIRPNFEGVINL